MLNDHGRLVLLSFLMLFVELTLIRWIGSNIFFISFFTNFVLLASFLGIGVGFLRPSTSYNLFRFFPLFFALLISLCYYFRYQYVIRIDPNTHDLIYFGTYFKDNFIPIEITLPIIFISVTITMIMIADGVKREFQKLLSLKAYRLEIIGSLFGVITFSILSFLHTPPFVWGGIICLSFFLLPKKNTDFFYSKWEVLPFLQICSFVLMMVIFGKESFDKNQYWSAYYKIGVQSYSEGRMAITVNGVLQQFIESVEQRKKYKPFYFIPYQHIARQSKLDDVLIVGAGTGGDIAIALSQGAKHVDAIEIDPLLYQLGKKLHPNKPYDDPRVHIFIDDGRAFLQKNKKLYDMVIFALPDSLMLIPNQASLRLENYLFTIEGITKVYQHLKPDGIFTMYSYYHSRWLADRLANTMTIVFKQLPCFDTFGANHLWLTVLTISPSATVTPCQTRWENTSYSLPATDNHPFVFLTDNSISILYIAALLFIVFTSLTAIKIAGASYLSITNYADLFLMGAAFLLLETKSIVNFALFFGTTWFVNALVLIGVLFSVYLAIEITYRKLFLPVWFLYSTLLVSLFLYWLIPNAFILSLPALLRFTIASIITFTPIFIANLIFAHRFNNASSSTQAFGANLMGAVIGGLLEYASLMIGYQNLTLLIIILYVLALTLKPYQTSRALT